MSSVDLRGSLAEMGLFPLLFWFPLLLLDNLLETLDK